MLLATLASATGARGASKARAALDTVLEGLPQDEALRKDVLKRLKKPLATRQRVAPKRSQSRLRQLAMSFRLHRSEVGAGAQPIPTRVAFWNEQDTIHAAAITGTTTVTERAIHRRLAHVERTVERLRNPDPKRVAQLGEELRQVLVPSDLREVFSSLDPLIIEVDRSLSRVQWEMLSPEESDGPLAVLRPVARQLRTPYSPRPFAITERPQMRALVIGDPGDPQRQHSLPDAQTEALEVSALLLKHGIQTKTLIGAPEDGTGAGPIEGVAPADFFEVVRQLLGGDFDLVHYTGHALFNPAAAARSGWLFKDGVLYGGRAQQHGTPAATRVANACVSLQLAQAVPPNPADAANARRRGDAQLVAGLADEFFRRGVSDYVGTAWEVPSKPAVRFASLFYKGLLRGAGGKGAPLTYGEALRVARRGLYDNAKSFGTTWGAYQHYGDPMRMLRVRTGF